MVDYCADIAPSNGRQCCGALGLVAVDAVVSEVPEEIDEEVGPRLGGVRVCWWSRRGLEVNGGEVGAVPWCHANARLGRYQRSPHRSRAGADVRRPHTGRSDPSGRYSCASSSAVMVVHVPERLPPDEPVRGENASFWLRAALTFCSSSQRRGPGAVAT